MCMHKTMYMCERMGGLAPSSLSDYSLSRNPPFTHTSPLESSWRKPLSSAELRSTLHGTARVSTGMCEMHYFGEDS